MGGERSNDGKESLIAFLCSINVRVVVVGEWLLCGQARMVINGHQRGNKAERPY